jgi:hypothetical protein
MTDVHSFNLDHQIEGLKTRIKLQLHTVERLKAADHVCDDATRQLDAMLRRYSRMISARHTPLPL